ncbi:MAG: hypothetical protein IH897_13905, partial [Planctomycetes bacterium]|nr:hypothetical protein [Planctomycetota bacterium]
MDILRGIAVTPGVAIGEAVILEAADYRIPYRTVAADKVEEELACLDAAFEKSIAGIKKQAEWLSANLGRDAARVFDWHVGVLKDPQLRNNIETLVNERKVSAAYAVSTVMRNYQRRFMQMTDPLLVERIR